MGGGGDIWTPLQPPSPPPRFYRPKSGGSAEAIYDETCSIGSEGIGVS